MNLFAHSFSKCAIDELVLFDFHQTFECAADDQCLEVLAVAFDSYVLAGEPGLDRELDGFGSDHDERLVPKLVSTLQQCQCKRRKQKATHGDDGEAL